MRGYTVEMSFLTPLMLLLIMSSIYVTFFFHDKNIIAGAAYETAVVGSSKARERDGVEAGVLEELLRERVDGKCILLIDVQEHVMVTEDQITVEVTAVHGRMKVVVEKRAGLTKPERRIREIKKIKDYVKDKLE